MGWAWVLAAGVIGWALRRRSDDVPAWALWGAPGVFFVCALAFADLPSPAARFTLEGLAFPYASEPQRTPLLHLGEAPSARAVTPTLTLPGLPAGGAPVDLFATPPVDEGVVTQPARLELRVPAGSRALVGFARRGDAFAFSNVVRLHGGESLVVCPGGRGECTERVLAVERSPAGGLKVGPCDLSGEPRQLTKPPTWGRPAERTLALLDLYHYETGRCVPQRVDETTAFWARRDGRGGWYLPMRSFLLMTGGDVRLALLDPPETLDVRGLRQEPAAGLTAEGPASHRLEILDTRVDVPFDVACQEDAAVRGDLSGGALCKRVRVSYKRQALDLYVARERVVVAPLEPPSITVDAVCESLSSCGLGDLQAAYFKDASLKDVRPNVPLLWFGLAATGGEPIAAHLRFEPAARECGDTPPPCLVVGTRDGVYVHQPGGRFSVGSPDGEQVFLRVTRLGVPWWLAGLLVGMLLAQMAVLTPPRSENRAFVVLASVVLVLLAARALFAFKLLARHPHDPEGLAGTLLGWACLPVALVLAGHALEHVGTLRAALALAMGLLVLVGLRSLGVVTLAGRQGLSVAVGLSALLLLAFALAWQGSRAWERLARGPERSRLWLTLLGLLCLARLLLALVGWERMGSVPLIALYWPAAIVLLTLVLRQASPKGLALPWLPRRAHGFWAVVLLGALAALAQMPRRGDTGSALVLGPPLLLATVYVWGERLSLRGRVPRVAAAALVLLAVGAYIWAQRFLDDDYPRVAAERAWAVRDADHKGQGYLCPADDDAQTSTALDLGPHDGVFKRGNLAVRRDDFVLHGASNRAGTRVGAEVHEFMAVLRRYAAGPSDAVGGAGYLSAEVRRYGTSEVRAQLADGAPSLLLASEGGTAAVFGLLALHALLLQALLRRHAQLLPRLRGPDAALSFAALACTGVPAWTTLLMAGGNFGLLPFTGQSTPLLAVFSGMDLVVPPTLWVLALAATRLAEERAVVPIPEEESGLAL